MFLIFCMNGIHSLSWLEGYNIRTSAIVNLCECSKSEMIFFCLSVIIVVNVVKKSLDIMI